LSGTRQLSRFVNAILHFSEQGTYGQFKPEAALSTVVGFTDGIFNTLPDNFRGLRLLLHDSPWLLIHAAAISAVAIGLLGIALFFLWSEDRLRIALVLSALLTLLVVEAVSFSWDPYHGKLQAFAVVLFWIFLAAGIGARASAPRACLLLLPVLLATIGGI